MAETTHTCATCSAEVSGNDDFCDCGARMVQYCFGCGRRLRLPAKGVCPKCGIQPALITDPTVIVAPPIQNQGKCAVCDHDVPIGEPRCGHCNSFVKKFKRFCTNPKCLKEVGLTDNACQACDAHFVLNTDDGWKFARWIVCGNWRCDRHDDPMEFDDWMAAYKIPWAFQTEKGGKIKIGALQSAKEPQKFLLHYFGQDQVRAVKSGDDEKPWTFRNQKVFWEFTRYFKCPECGSRNWKRSLKGPLQKYGGPLAKKYGPKAAAHSKKAVVDLSLVIWRLLQRGVGR